MSIVNAGKRDFLRSYVYFYGLYFYTFECIFIHQGYAPKKLAWKMCKTVRFFGMCVPIIYILRTVERINRNN